MVENSTIFWNSLYSLQQLEVLCDAQLQVQDDAGEIQSFFVHKIILATNSLYFGGLLQDSGQLQEIYYLDGTNSESLKMVISYIYRQIDYTTLQKHTDALLTAEALQIIRHRDEEHNTVSILNRTSSAVGNATVTQTENPLCKKASKQQLSKSSSQITSVVKPKVYNVACQTDADIIIQNVQQNPEFVSQHNHQIPPSTGQEHPPITDNLEKRISCEPATSKKKRQQKCPDYSLKDSDFKVLLPEDGSDTRRRSSRTPKMSWKVKESLSMRKDKSFHQVCLDELDISDEDEEGESYDKTDHNPDRTNSNKDESEDPSSMSLGDHDITLSFNSPSTKVYTINKRYSPPNEKVDDSNSTVKLGHELNIENTTATPENETTQSDTTEVNINLTTSNLSELSVIEKDLPQMSITETNLPQLSVIETNLSQIPVNKKSPLQFHTKLWKCSDCNKEFRKKMVYMEHRRSVHNAAPYECKSCSLCFNTQSGYSYHINRHHKQDSLRYRCTDCGKKFFLRQELASHMAYRHSDEKPFACQFCERSFKSKSMLSRHIQTYHSNTRSHECIECKKTFKTGLALKKHCQLHQKGFRLHGGKLYPDGKEYPCSFCGKIFLKRTQQRVHERLQHKQKAAGMSYLCTVCKRSFSIKHYLMQHIKNIHMARRYQCAHCSKLFMQNSDLQRHLAVKGRCKGPDVKKKPFSCPNCKISFSNKGNLTKHLQTAGRCKWERDQAKDVVVLVQEKGEPSEVQVITNSAGFEETVEVDKEQVATIVERVNDQTSATIMSLLGGDKEIPVLLETEDGEQQVIDLSNYPGAELLLQAANITDVASLGGIIQVDQETYEVIPEDNQSQDSQVVLAEDIGNVEIINDSEIVIHDIE